ncbi:uncharacterized protein [Coffea arabica]|uniref:Reverse transcriptase n=1 Tax=Coffea arabica TaxID=13443 RepID=A0ABM4W8L6_COFAR
MKALVWNYQGVGSPLTVPQLREANNLLSPNMIFLSETINRFNYMKKVQKILRFEESVIVEAMDRKEGMSLFWNNDVEVKQVVTTALTIIKALVLDPDNQIEWWFIGVYMSCDANIRRQQWNVLTKRKQLWGDKWLLARDFNDILFNEEKWGGRAREDRSFKDFNSFIQNNSLVDLGFNGNPWTWSNNWEDEGEIRQSLDRGLSSKNWCQNFDKAKCQHVETLGSDHSMLLIDNWPRIEKRRSRFFFDKRWLKREEINQVVEQAWKQIVEGNRMYRITRQVANCRVALLKWKNSFTGNTLLRINQVKQQIKEIKDSRDSGNKDKMAELKHQLKEAYSEEEEEEGKTEYLTFKEKMERGQKVRRSWGKKSQTIIEFCFLAVAMKNGFMAVKLDMSKAYDRVEWKFPDSMMAKMGFCTAEGNKRISGMKISRNGPSMTHLFFANDSLIFCKADREEASELIQILNKYEKGSGQSINLEKSSVFFSSNVNHQRKKEDSISRRMNSWKNKLLSQGGKEVLLKAVSMAMPVYIMSYFKLPNKLCKEVSSMFANYWWGEAEGRNKMHWCLWGRLTKEKQEGGMGFKDLQNFNKALLAKQERMIAITGYIVVMAYTRSTQDTSKAQEVWKMAPLQWDGLKEQTGTFQVWWTAILEATNRTNGKEHIELTVNILWQLWKRRNEWKFNAKQRHPWKIVQKAQ